jgi:hypothetical protein
VRDYVEGHGQITLVDPWTHRPADFSDREPLLGFYDEMRQQVVDAEIQEAASEGIGFFAFYWDLDPTTGREMPVSAPVRKFFASPFANRIGFLLAPIVGPETDARMSLATWEQVIVPQIIDYMVRPSYYRVNGRPVLVDFKLPFVDTDTYAKGYAYLRTAVAERLGVSPLIINLLGPHATYRDLVYRAAKLHPDGFTCFNFPLEGQGEPYMSLARSWIPKLLGLTGLSGDQRDLSLTFIPCGSVGIDARPWYGIGWTGYEGKSGPYSRPYTIHPTADEFRQHLEDLKRFIKSGRVRTLSTVILYAWNEWGEAAASIEPSKVTGYRYADTVRDVFGLVPLAARP